MKRIVLLILAVILIVTGLFLLVHVSSFIHVSGQGALQVTANVKSNVYLNGSYVGTTPFCKCKQNDTITEGDYTVKVEPQDKSVDAFTIKTHVYPGVLTAVERTFLPGALASAYVLTLEKNHSSDAEMMITSLPDNAMVTIDSLAAGVTPHLEQKVTASEHEIEIQKNGFAKKTIRVRAVPSYKLNINVILGVDSGDITLTPSPTPAVSTSPAPSTSPTPTISGPSVKILDTPTGFLRVRSAPGGTEITQVSPGEVYKYLDEQSGWYKIQLKDKTTGWVSSQYAEKEGQ